MPNLTVKEYFDMCYRETKEYYIGDDVIKLIDSDYKTVAIIKSKEKYGGSVSLPKKYKDCEVDTFDISIEDSEPGDEGYGYNPGHIEVSLNLKEAFPGVKDKEPPNDTRPYFGFGIYNSPFFMDIPSRLNESSQTDESEPPDFLGLFNKMVEDVMDAHDKAILDGWFKNPLDNISFKQLPSIYTKPVSITLKRAFLAVIGAFGSMYELLPWWDIERVFKNWLEYKKNEK